mgnify:CR=1 FL=1
MSFYKIDSSGEMLSGPTVQSSEYHLTAETRGSFTLPIDGWYWFDSDLDAIISLQPLEALKILQVAITESPTLRE